MRERNRPLIYLAAPLFSLAEREFNVRLALILEQEYSVFLPQRDGELLVELISRGIDQLAAKRRVFENDLAAIRRCDIVVAVLDGRTIDEGVAFELGVAFALKKRCIGLQTDPRRLLFGSNNPMIDSALEAKSVDFEELIRLLRVATSCEGAS